MGAEHDLKFTRSRSGNKNDGAHVEQKNWTAARQLVGYLRYDTEAELLLLNRIWALLGLIGNHFYPQQKLISPRSATVPKSPRSTTPRPPPTPAPTSWARHSRVPPGPQPRPLTFDFPIRQRSNEPGPLDMRQEGHPTSQLLGRQ